ncbi:MAG: alanine--tRNA ligase-related protein [Candidatus Gracilibacteria bacterium]|jgi:alanyl-tRNA synthetase
MLAKDLRTAYIRFFTEKYAHKAIPSSSLIPENDPTVLFTTAGMHPLVPYLLGESHPEGKRLVDVQKCIRTDDIEEVGDATHCTFFEMLGNWSLGDYFKEEAIEMSYKFLTEELGIRPDRLMVTCFLGDSDAPRDEAAASAWERYGFRRESAENLGEKQLIFFYKKKKNWWGPAGQTGPCGPDTEIFFDTCPELKSSEHKPGSGFGGDCHPNCDCGHYTEIWNNVFMEYRKTEEGKFEPLAQKNVDTGMGLERVTCILQGKKSHYETELFAPVMEEIRVAASDYDEKSARIVADHLRTAIFILGDQNGVTPSNNGQGYILRRLIRRAVRYGRKLGIRGDFCTGLAEKFIEIYKDPYRELEVRRRKILDELKKEEKQFAESLENGEIEIQKDVDRVNEAVALLRNEDKVCKIEVALNALNAVIFGGEILSKLNGILRPLTGKLRAEFKADAADKSVDGGAITEARKLVEELAGSGFTISGDRAFYYFESFGFPLEMTTEIMKEKGVNVDEKSFEKAFSAHQEKSREGSNAKFAGGLADHSEQVRNLHTATHLMLEALHRVLGKEVSQKGSNITSERLRFDFNYPNKLTNAQLAEVEKIVNDAIEANYKIHFEEMSVEDARKLNATGIFADKYECELGGKVKVYFIGDYSTEICGGPHAESTGELHHFKIVKEEASSSGVRRIKAVLD